MFNSSNRTNCSLECEKVRALSHNKLHTVMTSRADFASAVLRNSYNSPKRRSGRTRVAACSYILSLLSSFRALRIHSDFEITRRHATSAINDRLQKKDRRETEENKRKRIEFIALHRLFERGIPHLGKLTMLRNDRRSSHAKQRKSFINW